MLSFTLHLLAAAGAAVQVLGTGHALEEFYTNAAVQQVRCSRTFRRWSCTPARSMRVHALHECLIMCCPIHACGMRTPQAYKNYVAAILGRVNSITGVKYSLDPTIFAIELANEPVCSTGYEDQLGVARGSIIKAWIAEMAAYIRSLDAAHMVRCAATLSCLFSSAVHPEHVPSPSTWVGSCFGTSACLA